jgi:phytoene dehydrogenase-like protein
MHEERIWDAVVVGAGAAGLLASIHLVEAGRNVLVLERGTAPGGRSMTTELEGALVNLGPHALYQEAIPLLKEVGVEPTGGVPKLNGAMVTGAGPEAFRAVPMLGLLLGRSLTWGEKTEFLRFYASLRRIGTEELRHVTLEDYLAKHVRHPRVRLMIKSFVRVATYCNAPRIASAGAMIDQLKKAVVIYPNGGWQTIVDGLCAQAEKHGVMLQTQAGVRRIISSEPELAVELNGGERIRTRSVLCTTGPKQLLELLDTAPSPAYEANLRSLVPMYAACLDVVLDGLPAPKSNFALGVDRPLYYSNHSRAARLSSNPNHAVVHVMNYLPAGTQGQPGTEASEAELERLLDTLQPGWRKRVVARRYMPRLLVSHAVVTAENGGLQGRPAPAVAGVPGVYAAGDWVGGEGMLLGASLYSARKAARVMIEDSEARHGMRE